MDPLLVYTSMTGNTRTFVDFIRRNISVDVSDTSVNITSQGKLIIGTYTWAGGKIPLELKDFLIRNKDQFKDKEVFIFGSGYSIYPKFCGAVDGVSKIVLDCGGIIKGTFKFEQRFLENEYSKEELDDLILKMR
jgi:flavodoxin I